MDTLKGVRRAVSARTSADLVIRTNTQLDGRVKSELIRLPNCYLLLMSGSVIASQEVLRGGADVDLMYLLHGVLQSVLKATELGRPGLWARSLRLEDR